jgi:hypothetical protein
MVQTCGWRHDTQHKGIICDTQHNKSAITLSAVMLIVAIYFLLC